MNNLSKIFLIIIIILSIALTIMAYALFKSVNVAHDNLKSLIEANGEIVQLRKVLDDNDIDFEIE